MMPKKEFLEELLEKIDSKNSWGKNELKELILNLIIKHLSN